MPAARRQTLRRRLALAFGVLGLTLSLLFAAVAAFVAEDYEHILIGAVLRAEGAAFGERRQIDPEAELPRGPYLRGYRLGDADNRALLPPELLQLPLGVFEPEVPGLAELHVAVIEAGGERFLFLIDTSEIKALEQYLYAVMGGIAMAGAVLSAWLGWWLAVISLQPLARLADAVDVLPDSPKLTRLGADQPADELGRLAMAIDRFEQRLLTADQQQRALFAEASHALRTPIAVVHGAVELLLDDAHGQPSRPLARIARGIGELARLLDALLLVARGSDGRTETIDLHVLLDEVLQQRAEDVHRAGSRLERSGACQALLVADRRRVAALLDCLLTAALESAAGGRVALHSTEHGLQLEAVGADGAADSDRGLAWPLAQRLSQALGWSLVASGDPQRRVFELRWPEDA